MKFLIFCNALFLATWVWYFVDRIISKELRLRENNRFRREVAKLSEEKELTKT